MLHYEHHPEIPLLQTLETFCRGLLTACVENKNPTKKRVSLRLLQTPFQHGTVFSLKLLRQSIVFFTFGLA